MSKVTDTINSHLIPLLNQKWRDNTSSTIIEGVARAIVDSAKEYGVKVSDLNLDDITSELWQKYIEERISE